MELKFYDSVFEMERKELDLLALFPSLGVCLVTLPQKGLKLSDEPSNSQLLAGCKTDNPFIVRLFCSR
jgi:hypothetical protein